MLRFTVFSIAQLSSVWQRFVLTGKSFPKPATEKHLFLYHFRVKKTFHD
jgi:hypothetical protein